MDLQLNDKTALVTGSTAGIGYAIALGLAREGAKVTVNGRTQARVDEAIAKIAAELPLAEVNGIAADLSTAEGVQQLTGQLPQIDILINNMGIFEPREFTAITDDEWMHMFETNVMSGVRLSRAYIAGMKERNWGRIVFISSESAANIPEEMIHYGVTKTAQVAVARGLAETTARTGVTVNTVLPGPTASEGVGTFVEQLAKERGLTSAEMEQEFFKTARPTSLLQRFITPEEVANMVVYVASEAAAATNGAALRVEGGLVRSIF